MSNVFIRHVPVKTTSLISLLALILFLPLFILAVRETVTLISRATGRPASIVVDTKATLETIRTDFYRAFAQGGEESSDMLAPITAEIRALQPKIIRIDHIYDHYDVVGRSGSELTFNWDKLDQAIESILATGAKPMLALSYMPAAIARDGSIINPPNDWNEWAIVVQRTIEHVSGSGGKNIADVYYEVWNEPDLAQFGGWKYHGEKSYLTLYRYAADGAKNARGVNRFFLGGPSTTGLYKNWIIALVKSGNRLDFLSWHSYLMNPAQFARDQRNIVSWLLSYPQYTLIPKLITEFGFTGSKHGGYGTTFAAAHTAAVIRQLLSGGPKYLFSFQLKDGPGQGDGSGWGLITHEGNGKRAKPRYYIYNFLDTMAGTRLALTGEGTWVSGFATTRERIVRILLVNFDSRGRHTETVPVTFANLDPGTYRYRERFFLGRDATFTETISGNTLIKQVYMPAQSIAILELSSQ